MEEKTIVKSEQYNVKNFFKIMSKEQMIIKTSDPENLIIIYLIIKAVIIVVAHYLGLSMNNTLVSPYLF